MRRAGLTLFMKLMVAGCGLAMAQGVGSGDSGMVRPVLVELFTSEGCSSCPPADALLKQLDGKRTESGQLVVGLSEHVTYWNQLGWSDRFSADVYTARQEGYRSRFGLESAYTPQVVVNGEREVLGSDRGAVLGAVRVTDHPSGLQIRILSAKVAGDAVLVTYSVRGKSESRADLFAVIADDAATTRVGRGENSGRTLAHVSVARSLIDVGQVRAVEEGNVRVVLGAAAGARHVVLFAQVRGLGRVLAIDAAPLTPVEF